MNPSQRKVQVQFNKSARKEGCMLKTPERKKTIHEEYHWGHTRAKLKQKMAHSFKTDPVSENEDTVLKKVKEQMNTSDPWNIFKLYT